LDDALVQPHLGAQRLALGHGGRLELPEEHLHHADLLGRQARPEPFLLMVMTTRSVVSIWRRHLGAAGGAFRRAQTPGAGRVRRRAEFVATAAHPVVLVLLGVERAAERHLVLVVVGGHRRQALVGGRGRVVEETVLTIVVTINSVPLFLPYR